MIIWILNGGLRGKVERGRVDLQTSINMFIIKIKINDSVLKQIVLSTLHLVLCSWYLHVLSKLPNEYATYLVYCAVLDTWFLAMYCMYLACLSIGNTSTCTLMVEYFLTEIYFSCLHVQGSWSDNVQSIWCQSWLVECRDNCVPVSNRKSPFSGLLTWKQFKKAQGF